jgi:multiple sugar transport system ATP-binding protein
MATVTFDHVTKKYGEVTAVEDLNLEIHDGEFMVLVGPSGCGKTTSLRMIAGLEEITAGTLKIGDRIVNDVAPKDRDIAMVFQSYALYPHMSARDNLAFGLKLRKVDKKEIERRVAEAAAILDLGKYLDRKPKELSGGQRQRVALGRAIVREPAVFLMDEPLSNLDAKLRVQTRAEIARLHQRLRTTIVYVTHDQVEAMTMGQRIAVMSQAKLQQVGTPQDLYDRPDNKFVAGFIGSPAMNFFPMHLEGFGDSATLRADGLEVRLPDAFRGGVSAGSGRNFVLGVRPEHLDVVPTGGECATAQSRADVVEYLGNEELLHVMVGGIDVVALVSADRRVRPGDVVTLHIPLDKIHLFDAETELAVNRAPQGRPAVLAS